MYVALFAGLTKNKKIQQALINFLQGPTGMFAGLAVMLYPNDVFITTIGINIQTMVHHGAMMVVGVAAACEQGQAHLEVDPRRDRRLLRIGDVAILLELRPQYPDCGRHLQHVLHQSAVSEPSADPLADRTARTAFRVFVGIYIVGPAVVADLMLLDRHGGQ
ncbi:MAG: hypothetical protein MZU97_06565 [Bacillus subtilis]|nr:hypothetical protein [Bacillus subtilis]